MKVRAQLKNYRMSPQKVRTVARLIRGTRVDEALARLGACPRKSSHDLASLLKSAVANAKNNFQINENDLFVSDVVVDEGMRLKRWMPRAYGRATKIIKRMAHISIIVEEKKDLKKTIVKEESNKQEKKVEKKSEKKTHQKMVKKEQKVTKDNEKKNKNVKKASNTKK
jgi:large subunit ribosomal protein L22